MNKEDGEMFWYLMVFTALCGAAVILRKAGGPGKPGPYKKNGGRREDV